MKRAMKITPFTIAPNLSLGVFASLWCFAAQAQEVVEVFRLSDSAPEHAAPSPVMPRQVSPASVGSRGSKLRPVLRSPSLRGRGQVVDSELV